MAFSNASLFGRPPSMRGPASGINRQPTAGTGLFGGFNQEDIMSYLQQMYPTAGPQSLQAIRQEQLANAQAAQQRAYAQQAQILNGGQSQTFSRPTIRPNTRPRAVMPAQTSMQNGNIFSPFSTVRSRVSNSNSSSYFSS